MMADEKVIKKIIKQVDNTPVKTAEEHKTFKEIYESKCAIVEMLESKIDVTDPLNPVQKGQRWDHFVDSAKTWDMFLHDRVMLNAQMVKVKQLPAGWPTVKEWEAKQKEKQERLKQ